MTHPTHVRFARKSETGREKAALDAAACRPGSGNRQQDTGSGRMADPKEAFGVFL